MVWPRRRRQRHLPVRTVYRQGFAPRPSKRPSDRSRQQQLSRWSSISYGLRGAESSAPHQLGSLAGCAGCDGTRDWRVLDANALTRCRSMGGTRRKQRVEEQEGAGVTTPTRRRVGCLLPCSWGVAIDNDGSGVGEGRVGVFVRVSICTYQQPKPPPAGINGAPSSRRVHGLPDGTSAPSAAALGCLALLTSRPCSSSPRARLRTPHAPARTGARVLRRHANADAFTYACGHTHGPPSAGVW